MASQTKTSTKKSADSGAQGLAERVVEVARNAGHSYLDTVETTAKRVAELQTSVGEASGIGWISAIANTQAEVTGDVTEAYVSAGRELIG